MEAHDPESGEETENVQERKIGFHECLPSIPHVTMEGMHAKGLQNKAQNYSEFVFFSAGPVGDHALIIDYANRFFESSGKPSTILMKHPNAFLRDLGIPYFDHISYVGFDGLAGKLRTLLFAVTSIWKKRVFVLVLPIPPPRYLKLFAFFIRFFTRSRMVALESQCGFSIPGGPVSSADFVGKNNYIPARVDTELYYEEANRMLQFLGYAPVDRVPRLTFIDHPEILERFNLEKGKYIALHIRASGPDRSLPPDRWNSILKILCEKLPGVTFAFTGTAADMAFIHDATEGVAPERVRFVTNVTMQELLSVYAHAGLDVTVHTGNAHLINMLHAPAVTVNFKGVHMFRFIYNEKGNELYSSEGCTCHPLERKCSMVEYKGQGYMACLFNTKDEEIVSAVMDQYARYATV
jgi:ADP-heptose:LPS heptosyltransferase